MSGRARVVTGLGANETRDTISRWSLGTLVAGIEISPVPSRIAPAGSGTPTTADSPESTVVEPTAFRAVTFTRILWLTSFAAKR